MTRNKYILSGFILLVMVVFSNCGQGMAVVPYPISTQKSLKARTKEERLSEIIKKIEAREEENVKFYQDINKELEQILKKDGNEE